jgi:uncharacterized protein (DUF736 family)
MNITYKKQVLLMVIEKIESEAPKTRIVKKANEIIGWFDTEKEAADYLKNNGNDIEKYCFQEVVTATCEK